MVVMLGERLAKVVVEKIYVVEIVYKDVCMCGVVYGEVEGNVMVVNYACRIFCRPGDL